MRRNILSCSMLLAITAILVLPLSSFESTGKSMFALSGVAIAGSCVTVDCHASLGQAEFVHQPVADGDCLSCHEVKSQPHPGDSSVELLQSEPELCLECHENPASGMEYPHSAVEEGCSSCHNPHQGHLPKFVSHEGGELCLECHDVVLDGEMAHGPVKANNCGICHGIHGGKNEWMLNLPGKENCFACHQGIKKIIDGASSQHDPVANGVCWDCHKPHTADFAPYLLADYPEGFYSPFEHRRYELCFECHEEKAFTYWLTSEATGFRNHNDNLHSFHVNRMVKGRVCKSCHGVHGADQGKLLMSKVPDFGRWDIPLSWVAYKDGAACFVGCHAPKQYDRTVEAENP